jgi:hypothetical protein
MTQDEYIAILFDDLGFDSRNRKAFLEEYYGVQYVDELPKSKKSELISQLKEQKDERL